VADKDPWLGVDWKVYAVQGAGGPHLKPSGKEGSFTLSTILDSSTGQTAYMVDFADGDMPPCWRGLLLYARGATTFSPPVPPLLPWTPSGDAPWLAAADAVRAGLNDSMARLTGALTPNRNAALLTLVCVSNATTAGTPLLVLKLTGAAAPGSIQPLDVSGGGHGDN
jgi:hypothetical protein